MIPRRIINFLAAIILVFAIAPGLLQAAQGSGGPDDGGYIFEDSNDPGGPAYNWEEISSTGTKVNLANNAMSSAIPLPFTFRFYGADYNQVYISSNGFLTFLSGQPDSKTPAAIPNTATPNNMIAGYWADLNPAGSGASVTYATAGSSPDQRFIIQFNAVPYNGSTIKVNFEFKLFEGSNTIEVHYNSMTNDGNPHGLGIENQEGTAGLQYYHGVGDITNSLAIRYSIFTGVALRPEYEIKYGLSGTSVIFTQRIANWTGTETTFNLSASGDTWPTAISMGGKDFTTTPMANGESQNFTIQVDIPSNASPGDYSQLDINVSQGSGGSYTADSSFIAAVPRRGYGLGYFDIDDTESAPGIVQVDTKFHNSLHEPVNVDSLGQYIHYGAISPNGQQLWVVDSGAAQMAYAIDLDQINGPYHSIPAGNEASDVAFTPDSKTAVISSYGSGNVEIVDMATYTVTSTLATGKNSLKTAIGACFPRKAYVTNLGANTVSVVNLLTKTVTNISGFNKPHGVVVSPKTNRAYVSNNGAATIMVIDTLTDRVVATWNISGADAMANIGITSDGEKIYIASNTTVKVIDANNGSLIATINTPLDKLWDLEVFPEGMGNYAYVTSSNLNYSTILVIDTESNTVAKQIQDAWGVMGLALFPSPSECKVAPQASFTPNSVVARVNEPVSWTNTSIYGATEYTWDFGDSTPVSHDEHPTHVYTEAGSYTVTLTATNSQGTSTATGTVYFAPNAGFTPQNNVIYLGDEVGFTNQSTGTAPLNYSWNFGDGATSSEKDPTHTYTAIGDYTVTLTVSNVYGTATATGKVDFAPVAAFTPVNTTIRPGEQVAFTNNSTGSNTSSNPLAYLWDFGDGSTSTETSPTHSYAGTADATVHLTAHNGFGEDSTATGTVKFTPKAQFTPAETVIVIGDSVNFTDQSIGPGTFTYSWDFGDGTTSDAQNPEHTYASVGEYTVTQTVTNSNGSDIATGNVIVSTAPVANFIQSDSVIHVNDTVTFTNTTTGTEPITYTWDFGDGSETSSAKNPTHQYTTVGNYTVTLTATNTAGTSTKTGEIHFFAEAAFGPPSNVIQTGDTVSFTNQSTGSTPLTYIWDFGDGSATSTATNPIHQYITAGSYTVTLIAHNPFGEDSIATGTVVFKPKAAFTPIDNIIHVGDTVSFTNQSTGTGALTYAWDFGDGSATSTAANPTHQYSTAGSYTVTLTATSATYGSHSTTGMVLFAPTAGFTPTSSTIQTGDTITFANTSVGTNTSPNLMTYTWDFGDGSATSTATNPTHQYTTAGSYTVSLTAHNGLGTDSTATGTVVFRPKAIFTPLNSVIYAGDTVSFTNQSTGTGPLTYTWNFGDGSPTNTATSPTHQYNTVGSYTVTLTATSATYGTHSTTGTVQFAPTARFTPTSSTIQTGDSITFTNTSVGTNSSSNPLTYTWDFGDGTPTSSATNPTHQYSTAGNYTVRLTARNGLGTESTATGTVVFRPRAAFSPTSNVIQTGDTVSFTNQTTGTAPLTYIWDFGDGSATSTATNPTHQYTTAGSYTVTLTAHNPYGEDSIATGTVVFKPKAAFTPLNSVIHVGDTVSFTNQSTGTGPLTYTWNFGDGSPTSTAANPTHQYNTAGSYTVTLTATSATYGSHSTTGMVLFAPTARFTPTSSTIQTGDSITFTNTSVGTNTSPNLMTYTWDFGDGTPTSTATSPTHQYNTAGNYTVRLTARNGLGTESTATGTVVFRPRAAFSPTSNVIHVGDTVSFTNQSTGTGSLTFTWNFGDGSPKSTATNPTHQYTTAGVFTVTLTATSATYGSHSTTGTVQFAPTARFTPTSSTIQTGDSITFTNTSVGTNSSSNPLTYTWDFGDGTPTSTATNPTHQYSTAGNYTVRLTARNGLGTESTTTGTVVFRPRAAFIPLNSTIHVGDTVTFTNQTTGTATISYTWDFGDGSPVSHSTSPSHRYTTAGVYAVTLTATNAQGTDTRTGQVVFSPVAAFTPESSTGHPLVIKVGDTVQFANQSTGTAPLSYTWDFGDGTATSTAANPSHTYGKAGTFTVRLTVQNPYGSHSITGTIVFSPTVSFTPEMNVIHLGEDLEIMNLSVGTAPLTYTWDFGDGTPTSSVVTPSHIYTTAGDYTLRLRVSNAYGSGEYTGRVVFAPSATFTSSATAIKQNQSVNLTSTISGTPDLTITWDFGDGTAVSHEANPTHAFTKTGVFTVTLTVTNSYGTATYSMEIHSDPYVLYLPVIER